MSGTFLAATAAAIPGTASGTPHTGRAHPIEAEFTARWTRADARRIVAQSDPDAPDGASSLPPHLTMPSIPREFPTLGDGSVWVWDTWPLVDGDSRQYAVNGEEIVFALVADRTLGFDDRHTFARIGWFTRPADPVGRPADGGWTYRGHVFAEGVSGTIFEDRSFSHQSEWSGSARVFPDGTVRLFFTAVAFYRDDRGDDFAPYDPRIALGVGRLEPGPDGITLTGFDEAIELLRPDGRWYQSREQNRYVNYRDPFTFTDPAHPNETFMVFEGNSALDRDDARVTAADLGYAEGSPETEDLDEVNASGASYCLGNIGLARALDDELTLWEYLPPLLSANGVNDQLERPQVVVQGGRYYLFAISHRATYAPGLVGPDGVYGFVGDGLRSDYLPLNGGSGLVLGNPTHLHRPAGTPADPACGQHPHAYQTYSHYVMPGGLVQSFVDAVGGPGEVRRGGVLAPTVRIDIDGAETRLDVSYGDGGLGAWADVPADAALRVEGETSPCPREGSPGSLTG